jgi:hypothetical protein
VQSERVAGEGSCWLVGFQAGDDIAEGQHVEGLIAAGLARTCPAQLGHRLIGGEFADAVEVALGVLQLRALRFGLGAWQRRGGVASGLEVLCCQRPAATLGVVGEVQLADDALVLGWLIGRDVRDHAPVAERVEVIVDDERAPVRALQAEDLARLSAVKRDIPAQVPGASWA